MSYFIVNRLSTVDNLTIVWSIIHNKNIKNMVKALQIVFIHIIRSIAGLFIK